MSGGNMGIGMGELPGGRPPVVGSGALGGMDNTRSASVDNTRTGGNECKQFDKQEVKNAVRKFSQRPPQLGERVGKLMMGLAVGLALGGLGILFGGNNDIAGKGIGMLFGGAFLGMLGLVVKSSSEDSTVSLAKSILKLSGKSKLSEKEQDELGRYTNRFQELQEVKNFLNPPIQGDGAQVQT